MRKLTEHEAWVELYHMMRVMRIMPSFTDHQYTTSMTTGRVRRETVVREGWALCSTVQTMADQKIIDGDTAYDMWWRIMKVMVPIQRRRSVDHPWYGYLDMPRRVTTRLKYIERFINATKEK